jgi:hypothetical protein
MPAQSLISTTIILKLINTRLMTHEHQNSKHKQKNKEAKSTLIPEGR